MATLLNPLGGTRLLGNLKPLLIRCDTPSPQKISFHLDGSEVFSTVYQPGPDLMIHLDLTDILSDFFLFKFPYPGRIMTKQDTLRRFFSLRIGDSEESLSSCWLIRGRATNAPEDITYWLESHQLSFGPSAMGCLLNMPLWTTLFLPAQQPVTISVHPDHRDSVSLCTADDSALYTLDISYNLLRSLVGGSPRPVYYLRAGKITLQVYADTLKSEDEGWFAWENGLGGLDVFRFSGSEEVIVDSEDRIADRHDRRHTYDVESSVKYKRNTGNLDDVERLWLLDFFFSPRRYVYRCGSFIPIVMVGCDTLSSSTDTIHSYTITYTLEDSPALPLDLARTNDSPEDISLPDLADFPLPPHADLPVLDSGEGVLLPAMDPLSGRWGSVALGSIVDALLKRGGSEFSTLLTEGMDDRILSFLKTIDWKAFLQTVGVLDGKFDSVTAQRLYARYSEIATMVVQTLSGKGNNWRIDELGQALFSTIGSITHIPGFSGWGVSQEGDAEFNSLKIRGALSVEEFVKNRIRITIGADYKTSAEGIVESCRLLTDRTGVVTFRSEKGEGVSFFVGDRCVGKWVSEGGGVEEIYLEITAVNGCECTYSLQADTYTHPLYEGLYIAQVGHPTNKERQRGHIQERHRDLYYDGVTGWAVRPEHIYAINGNLEGIRSPKWNNGNTLQGSGIAISNAYVNGIISVCSSDGNSVRRLPYDKGLWSMGMTAYYYDRYEYRDHYWLWTGDSPTESEPSFENAGWLDEGITPEGLAKESESKIPAIWEVFPTSHKGVNSLSYNSQGEIEPLVYTVRYHRNGLDVTEVMSKSNLRLFEFFRTNPFGMDDMGIPDSEWNVANKGKSTVTIYSKDIHAQGVLGVEYDDSLLEEEYQKLK